MPIFDLYMNDTAIDLLFLQVQSNLVSTGALPPGPFHPSSPLAHYSLFQDMFDKFVIPTAPLNPLYIYLTDHGCN